MSNRRGESCVGRRGRLVNPSERAGRPARRHRCGFLLVQFALVIFGLLVLTAMAIDLAYVMHVRAEAQTSADAAALAGTWELIHPDRNKSVPDATQAIINSRTGAVDYAAKNEIAQVFPVVDRNDVNAIDGEVVVGHLPTWSYPPVFPWDTGSAGYLWEFGNTNKYNVVSVRVQRTEARNGPVQLLFGRIFGVPSLKVHTAATAIIEWGQPIGFKPTAETGPSSLLPFTILTRRVDGAPDGEVYGYYDAVDETTGLNDYTYDDSEEPAGPGRVSAGPDYTFEVQLYPMGTSAGNFGTIDLGDNDNSENVLERQILEGVNEDDVAALGGEIAIPGEYQGDTGISAGMKDELAAIIGVPRSILLYKGWEIDPGNNAMYSIFEVVGIVIVDVDLTGMPKIMTVQPCPVADDSVIIGGPPVGDTFPSVVRPPRLIH